MSKKKNYMEINFEMKSNLGSTLKVRTRKTSFALVVQNVELVLMTYPKLLKSIIFDRGQTKIWIKSLSKIVEIKFINVLDNKMYFELNFSSSKTRTKYDMMRENK